MKKLSLFFFTILLLSPIVSWGQTTVFSDNFSTNNNASYTTGGPIGASPWSVTVSGADWGARINTAPAQLELTNDASASANAVGWVYSSAQLNSFSAPYNTTLNLNVGLITWTFNFRTNRTSALAGFTSTTSYGMAMVLASTSNTPNTTGSGYAVVMGGGGSNTIGLIHFNNGLLGTKTTVVSFGGAPALLTNYMSVKVTYDPVTDTWNLHNRDDGASFADPAAGVFTSLGSAVNNTYTGTAMSYMGAYWQGSTSATQTTFFDNIKTTVTPTPIISATSLTGFGNQLINTTSAYQTYTVSGSNLSDDITITPPAGFKISLTSGAGYVDNTGSLTLTQTGGSVNATTIYVVFNPTALQSYTGNIAHTSTGTTTKNVAVSGMGTQNYYSASSGNLDNTGNWGTNTDGSGANPSDFTTAGQIFNIRNNTTPTIGANWTVSGTGSKIVVGDGTNACNFTIPSSYSMTGTVDVSANGTLTIQNTTLPTFGTINSSSTIDFASSSALVVPASTYGNLKLSNGTKTFASGATTIQGNLTVNNVTGLNGAGSPYSTVNLSGNLNLLGAVSAGDVANGMTLVCNGSGIQTITGNGNNLQLFRLTVNNSNGVILSTSGGSSNVNVGNANGGGVTMTSGNLITNSNTVTLYNSSNSSISSEAAGKYIIGNVSVTKAVASGASSTFGNILSLGTATGDLGNVNVTRVTGSHVTLNGNTGINRIWTITPTITLASARNITLGWISDDDNAKTLTSMQVYQSTDNFATAGNASMLGSPANGTSRSVTVSLTSLSGGSTLAFTISQSDQPLVLEAPVASAATSGTSSGFTANWSSSLSATTYLLDVSTTANFSSYVAGYQNKDVGNVTTYAVSESTVGITYYYRVKASNVNGASANSNTIAFILVSTPVATAATNIGSNYFTANWNSSATSSSYLLDVSTASDFSTFVAGYNNKNVGNVTTYNLSSLTSRTTYYYRVRASNAGGTSPNSNTITAATTNQAPILASIEQTKLSYLASDPPTIVSNTITVSDPDDPILVSAEVQITGFYQNGSDLLGYTDANGISGSWDATFGKLSLSGIASLANYQAALRSITYHNTSSSPFKMLRKITFKVNDGLTTSNISTREIDLGKTPPILGDVETDTLLFRQGDIAQNVTSSITVKGEGIYGLEFAVIQITGNYKIGEDLLTLDNPGQVTNNWNSRNGTLVLYLPSVWNYETIIRSVKYQNISSNPSNLPRTISFTVQDESSISNTVARIVKIVLKKTILLSTNNSTGGTTIGEGSFYDGSSVTVTATPNAGYKFVSWTEGGIIVSTDLIYSFLINSNRTLTANFEAIAYNVSTSAIPEEGGTTTGEGTFYYGNSVTVTASPNSGYEFANWTESSNVVSDLLNYTFLVTGNRNLVANFTTMRILSVMPEVINANVSKGTASIFIYNSGGGNIMWNAVSNVFWLTITGEASGTNNGELKISYSANNSIPRIGTIIISADGVLGSPKTVEVRQAGRLTDVEDFNLGVPDNYQVEQNYPNPFNPSTIIKYGLPIESYVKVTVYNILGEEVAKLFDGIQNAGFHEINFNATNLSSGIYIYKISAGNPSSGSGSGFIQIKKMLLIK